MNIESELKFAVNPAQQRKLLKADAVRAARESKARTRKLISQYFDTRQHSLRKSGGTLRVRQAGDSFEQTIKLPASGPAGMQNNAEWNVDLHGPGPDLRLFPREALQFLPRSGRRLRLQPVFTTVVQRTTVLLGSGKTRFELALDIGYLESPGTRRRQQPLCEVEFELVRGAALPMLEFILRLSEQVELQPLFMTKAQRGYALARPSLRSAKSKAKPVLLSPQMSVGEAFRRIIGEALDHLQRNQQLILDGKPGGIHQGRVAIRRIRAAMRAFKKALPYDKRKAFNGEFRWFQLKLAPARDWHVFISESLPRIARASSPAGEDLQQLHRLALRERRRATLEAQEVIAGQRYTRLLLQFQCWLHSLEKSHKAMFEMPLQPFARTVLEKTRKDFLLDQRPLSRMAEEDRHALRKRGKKARYAMEFFSALWEGPGVQPYLKLLEKIQDRLGEANDAVVARLLMASLPPRKLPPGTLLLVQDWSQIRELQCNRAGQPVWRRMQRAAPFWI